MRIFLILVNVQERYSFICVRPFEMLCVIKIMLERFCLWFKFSSLSRLSLCCMQDCKSTKKGGLYYEFRRNSRSVKSTILHFQVSEKQVCTSYRSISCNAMIGCRYAWHNRKECTIWLSDTSLAFGHAVEELGLGYNKAWCLPYVTFLCHSLVFINVQQVWCSWCFRTCCTNWGKFLWQ